MQTNSIYFTTGQLAKLHNLNKRTLHFYDDVGLFSPAYKAENGYRYYTCRQSADLENILALRELGMTILEIKDYLKCPDSDSFMRIAIQKSHEINEQIKRLKILKAILEEKRRALALCDSIYDGKIEVVRFPKRYLLLTPMQFSESALTDMGRVMKHLRIAWECSAYKTGCGSYISLDKIKKGRFESYDGLFTFVDKPRKGIDFQVRPEGEYLCGYCVGNWSKIPDLYGKMLEFAESNELELKGGGFEIGLNEFAISREEEYVTQIEIQCDEKSKEKRL